MFYCVFINFRASEYEVENYKKINQDLINNESEQLNIFKEKVNNILVFLI